MSLDELENQPQAKVFLKALLETGRLPHALLFQGPKGCGKAAAARAFAETLLGSDPKAHPDFLAILPEKGSETIKIGQIRGELLPRAHLRPLLSDRKVILIEEAHRLGEEAQNALLKTLEEPEGKTLFILTSSSPEKLLATVRSRLVTLKFLPVAAGLPASEEVQSYRKIVWEYLGEGLERGDVFPDLSKLERVQVTQVLDKTILDLRSRLLVSLDAPDAWIERIEKIAETKEKIEHNANIRVALAVLWDELGAVANHGR